MSYDEITQRLTAIVGSDTAVAFDDDIRPTELRFYRRDPLSMELVREALAKTVEAFPVEMSTIDTVFVSFDDRLGLTRRRVAF